MTNESMASQLANVLRLLIAGSEAWRATFNKHLIELARSHSLKVDPDANLLGIAMQGAARAGASGSQDIEDVAMEAISRLVSRSPRKGVGDMQRDYVSRTIIPSVIQTLLKSKRRLTLEDLKRDPRINEILAAFPSITDKMLEYRLKNPRPNKSVLRHLDTLQSGERRDSIFTEVDPKKPFEPLWATATKNQATDILRERNRVKDLVTKSLRFKTDEEDTSGIDLERNRSLSTDDLSNHEKNSLLAEFKKRLDRIDPRYRQVIKLMSDQGIDPSNPRHQRQFEKALGLDRDAFRAFTRKFVEDLRAVFRALDISFEEGSHLLRSAKARWKVQTRIFLEIHALSAQLA